MSDMPGTAAVGIDSVEWEAEDEGNLTLRVVGRWRRRPRGTSGKPTLILESAGRRHRFSALPEPPGLSGAAPGAWRLSFTLPGSLAPDLGRTWLQFGTVIVPLPIAMPSPDDLRASQRRAHEAAGRLGEDGEPPRLQAVPALPMPAGEAEPDQGMGETPEADERTEPADVGDLGERVAALERELRHARAGRDELAISLQERDRSRRIAEQRAHAEAALRQDLARQLSANLREMERVRETMGELAAAEERIRRLEAELELARRRSAEAEQLAAAARTARERAERERDALRAGDQGPRPSAPEPVPVSAGLSAVPDLPPEPAPVVAPATASTASSPGPAELSRLAFERRLAERQAAAGDRDRVPHEPVSQAVAPPAPVGQPIVPPRAPEAPAETPASDGVSRPPAAGPLLARPAAVDAVVPEVLRRELDARARAEAALRARLVDAESTLAARIVVERRTKTALDELRVELARLRDALAAERTGREQALARLADAEARAQEAQARAAQTATRAEQAERRAAQAESRAGEAEARIERAESLAGQAEAVASAAGTRVAQADARAANAEARAVHAEARLAQAEARVSEAEAERAAADGYAQTAGSARAAAETRAQRAEQRARAADARVQRAEQRAVAADRAARTAAAEAAKLREALGARDGERAGLETQVGELQARITELEQDLSGQRTLSRDAYDAIGDLRGALELLQARAEEARAGEARAGEARAGDAHAEEAGAPESESPSLPAPAIAGGDADAKAPVVDATRLTDALSRLRETVPAPEPLPDDATAAAPATPSPDPVPAAAVPERVATPGQSGQSGRSGAEAPLGRLLHRRSLEVPFRRLVRADADGAGRLLIELLPLQGAVHHRAVAYDLVLGEGRGCVCVTAPHGEPPIELRAHPRPREEVDFRVVGDPARIARLLTAGPVRRLLRIGVARVQGRREGLAALQALIATPLALADLHQGGVRLDPGSAFALVAGMIEPAWTRGERFIVAHAEDGLPTAYLVISDGRPPRATRVAPDGRVAATVACPGEELLAVLAGEPVAGLAIDGDEGPLQTLRGWIRQAEQA